MTARTGKPSVRKNNVNALLVINLRSEYWTIASEIIRILHIEDAVLQIPRDEGIDFIERLNVVVMGFAERGNHILTEEID